MTTTEHTVFLFEVSQIWQALFVCLDNELPLLDIWHTSMSYRIVVHSEHTAEVSSAFSMLRSMTCIHLRVVAVEVSSGFFLRDRQHAPSVCTDKGTAFCFNLHFSSTAINLDKQLTVLCRQTQSFMNCSTTTCFHKSSLHLHRLYFSSFECFIFIFWAEKMPLNISGVYHF